MPGVNCSLYSTNRSDWMLWGTPKWNLFRKELCWHESGYAQDVLAHQMKGDTIRVPSLMETQKVICQNNPGCRIMMYRGSHSRGFEKRNSAALRPGRVFRILHAWHPWHSWNPWHPWLLLELLVLLIFTTPQLL